MLSLMPLPVPDPPGGVTAVEALEDMRGDAPARCRPHVVYGDGYRVTEAALEDLDAPALRGVAAGVVDPVAQDLLDTGRRQCAAGAGQPACRR
jgi:hypothetical protein